VLAHLHLVVWGHGEFKHLLLSSESNKDRDGGHRGDVRATSYGRGNRLVLSFPRLKGLHLDNELLRGVLGLAGPEVTEFENAWRIISPRKVVTPVKWGGDKVGGTRKVIVMVGSGEHRFVSQVKTDFPRNVGDLIVHERPVGMFCRIGDARG
jgi:hypothetical protein